MADVARWDRLLDALAARTGIVCTVGAGGKKSTLFRLIEAHVAAGTRRVGLTATVMLALPPAHIAPHRLVAEPARLAREIPDLAREHRLIAYAQASHKPGRLGGLAPELVAELHAAGRFDVTLVKADGARMRLIKAPGPDEPIIPPNVATLVPVVSIKAIGRPLDERSAHRPERVAAVVGAEPGETLTPAHLARLLASDQGALHRVGEARVVPVINAVDDQLALAAARDVAGQALAMTDRFERVVLAAMTAPDPLVEIVHRG